jgi:hypothetical protein
MTTIAPASGPRKTIHSYSGLRQCKNAGTHVSAGVSAWVEATLLVSVVRRLRRHGHSSETIDP